MLTTRRHWPTGRKSRGFAAGAAWNLAGVAAQVASVADLLVWKARKSPLREVGKSVQTRGPGWGRTTRDPRGDTPPGEANLRSLCSSGETSSHSGPRRQRRRYPVSQPHSLYLRQHTGFGVLSDQGHDG
jgi:hypothetical protein